MTGPRQVVDVEATTAIRQAEVKAAKRMIERAKAGPAGRKKEQRIRLWSHPNGP